MIRSELKYFIDTLTFLKGELQQEYKLPLYERACKILKNDMCITAIGQAVLELWSFSDEQENPPTGRKMSVFDISNSPMVPKIT